MISLLDTHILLWLSMDNGYAELSIDGAHAGEVASPPMHHSDPFDRIQIAQARVEGLVLVTADPQVAQYGSPVQLV